MLGDFNSCDLKKTLPGFKQYVNVPTYKTKTIDLCYGNIPLAYKSRALPPIGQSDHSTVHLIPTYKPRIQTEPVIKKQVKVWTDECEETLRGCFECTDWDVLLDSSNVDVAADVVSDYITFCEDLIVPTKTVLVYPNNKPWISKSLKHTLNEKKIAFQSGNRTDRKLIQVKLRKEIKENKRRYREKVEQQFQSGNLSDAWKGIKILAGQDSKKGNKATLPASEQHKFVNDLNEFYCRFERTDTDEDLNLVIKQLHDHVERESMPTDFEIQSKRVEDEFSKIKTKKASGPDNISGRLLKACASQLCQVFSILFNWSLKDCSVPAVWKNSIICPVPKKTKPTCLNDYRPVALTSVVMKCFERIVLGQIVQQTQKRMDPHQFAYKPNRSTDDATLTLLHNAYTHLDTTGSFVRILFVDFSSAFNTIQPHLMAQKLLSLELEPKLILWVVNFLVHRNQAVRFQNAISCVKTTSTGSPQGTVLSPILFTLYTNDCNGNDVTPLIKYSDDTALIDLSNSDAFYFDQVKRFCDWCKDNFLDLNVSKTKELVIDFRSNAEPIQKLEIRGVEVERVDHYKYLGTVIDSNLDFTENTNSICEKCQPRIRCLQKLRNIGVNAGILQNFYRSCVESVLIYSFISWYGGVSVKNKNALTRVVNVCSKVVGVRMVGLNELYERRVKNKGRKIADDEEHVLSKQYELLRSGRRYRVPKFMKARGKKSFIPQSIKLLNE